LRAGTPTRRQVQGAIPDSWHSADAVAAADTTADEANDTDVTVVAGVSRGALVCHTHLSIISLNFMS